jgi:hypothetical protein
LRALQLRSSCWPCGYVIPNTSLVSRDITQLCPIHPVLLTAAGLRTPTTTVGISDITAARFQIRCLELTHLESGPPVRAVPSSDQTPDHGRNQSQDPGDTSLPLSPTSSLHEKEVAMATSQKLDFKALPKIEVWDTNANTKSKRLTEPDLAACSSERKHQQTMFTRGLVGEEESRRN